MFRSIRSLGALVVVLFLSTSILAKESSDNLNFVIILSDNQSFYEMSSHGHTGAKTPNLDKLAEQGVDFKRFYAPPYCSPSRSVMMTGKYALRSGIHNTIGGRSIMHKDESTVADILSGSGYKTSIFGKWHLGFSYPHKPKERGFDEVFVHSGGGIGQLEDYYNNSHHNPTFDHNGKTVHSKGYSTDVIFDQAMTWMEKQVKADQPFFTFVSTPVVHTPHHGPKDKNGKNTGLQGMLKNLDENVGRMMAKISQLGLADNTVLVFASDQGMSYRGSPMGFRKTYVAHDAMHHVPFIVRMPGVKSHVNNELTGMIDFVPTILDLADVELPSYMDGHSLKPLLVGKPNEFSKDRTLIIQCPRGRMSRKWKNASVKQGPWRVVAGKQLYNVNSDPMMELDVAAQHPDILNALNAEYEVFWNSLPEQQATLSRHILSDKGTVLNAMDWYKGAQPWELAAIRKPPGKRKGQNGSWAITVEQDGEYQFELRRFPREAALPIEAQYAKLRVGNQVVTAKFAHDADHVNLVLALKAGDYDLKTWLDKKDNYSLNYGAVFVYVTKKANTSVGESK